MNLVEFRRTVIDNPSGGLHDKILQYTCGLNIEVHRDSFSIGPSSSHLRAAVFDFMLTSVNCLNIYQSSIHQTLVAQEEYEKQNKTLNHLWCFER